MFVGQQLQNMQFRLYHQHFWYHMIICITESESAGSTEKEWSIGRRKIQREVGSPVVSPSENSCG